MYTLFLNQSYSFIHLYYKFGTSKHSTKDDGLKKLNVDKNVLVKKEGITMLLSNQGPILYYYNFGIDQSNEKRNFTKLTLLVLAGHQYWKKKDLMTI